jgi:hypothetical protein
LNPRNCDGQSNGELNCVKSGIIFARRFLYRKESSAKEQALPSMIFMAPFPLFSARSRAKFQFDAEVELDSKDELDAKG